MSDATHKDCLRDQSQLDANLKTQSVLVDTDYRAAMFGRILRQIAIDDDARWLKLQTTPRTYADAFGSDAGTVFNTIGDIQ